MTPPTFEQVLARSMRLPRALAQRQLPMLFARSDAASAAAGDTTRPQASPSLRQRGLRQHQHPTPRALPRGFFDALAAQEAAERAGRLRLRASSRCVGNTTDLQSYLTSAQRMGAWREGLDAFLAALGVTDTAAAVAALGDAAADTAAELHIDWARVDVTATHAALVLDMCAHAGCWRLVRRLTLLCGRQWPEVLTHGATCMVRGEAAPPATAAASAQDDDQATRNSDEAAQHDDSASMAAAAAAAVDTRADGRHNGNNATTTDHDASDDAAAARRDVCGWRHVLQLLTSCVEASMTVPVDAYHACLRGCEAACDWRGAFDVLRAMGRNPLCDDTEWLTAAVSQDVHAADTTHDAAAMTAESTTTTAATQADDAGGATTAGTLQRDAAASESSVAAHSAPSRAPQPNVVTYAILLATLEQAGRDDVARAVLRRLPPVERDEISSSYAALIMVWSRQLQQRARHIGYSPY